MSTTSVPRRRARAKSATAAATASGVPARRAPRQARSLQKVELVFEATVRLLERGGIEAVTTEAIAATAGISVGTLYQYFAGKEAVLGALVEREMAGFTERLTRSLDEPPGAPGDRLRAVIRAALDLYGSRRRAHRALLLHALNRGTASRLAPGLAQLIERLSVGGVATSGRLGNRLSPAEAFVLIHAMSGVLRAMTAIDKPPSREDVEDALVRLVLGFWPINDTR